MVVLFELAFFVVFVVAMPSICHFLGVVHGYCCGHGDDDFDV